MQQNYYPAIPSAGADPAVRGREGLAAIREVVFVVIGPKGSRRA